jgi:lysozyme
MKMTEEGLALIRAFEGFRSEAYRCPAGVWTIGYGHTSRAGPPEVTSRLNMTEPEAAAVLARDVDSFMREVRACLKRELTDAQFSALVSFAFNVGIGNLKSSSVLKAINSGDLDSVPRRLNLWVKAGGRVLPGLVRRRAAEAQLFLSGAEDAAGESRTTPEQAAGKPAYRSTTIFSALLAAGSAITAMAQPQAQIVAVVATAIVVAAALWIIRERRRLAREEGL